MRQFALWKTPRSPRAFILAVELLCVTWLLATNVSFGFHMGDYGRFLLLLGVAAIYAEGGDRIERLRRYVGYVENSTFADGSSQWCLAAALVLAPAHAGLLVAVLGAHSLFRATRHRSAVPYRIIYTAATAVCAAMAASAIVGQFVGDRAEIGTSPWSVLGVLLAFATYTLVQEALIVSAIYLVVRPQSFRSVLGSAEDRAMECATLALGVLLAVAVLHAPYLAPIALLLILVLRRSALVRVLQVQATRDAKTGLLNAGAWRTQAERELVRAERLTGHTSVLMIDLDHFKTLNDEHGHQAGDEALKAVADCLTEALRGYDAVGRFGGEEFVALLSEADVDEAVAVANRLCDRIRNLHLPHGAVVTASVGVGTGRSGEHDLDTLIAVADKALYAAKHDGRDRVNSLRAAPTLRQQRSA